MTDIRIDIQGDEALEKGLHGLRKNMPSPVNRALKRIAIGIHSISFDLLGGSGAKASNIATGGYPPVPIRSGHLRRQLNFLHSGKSKSFKGKSFSSDEMGAMVYNAASYADIIHSGRGSSRKFGPREYLDDALETFTQGNKVVKIVAEELVKEIKNEGLA